MDITKPYSFGIPHLDSTIPLHEGYLTLITQDMASIDGKTFLRLIATANSKRNLIIFSDEPIDLFAEEKNTETPENLNLVIAWRYKRLMGDRKYEFNLNKSVKFEGCEILNRRFVQFHSMSVDSTNNSAEDSNSARILARLQQSHNCLCIIFSLPQEINHYELKKLCKVNKICLVVLSYCCFVSPSVSLQYDTVLVLKTSIGLKGYHGLLILDKFRVSNRVRSVILGYNIKRLGIMAEDYVVHPENTIRENM